MFYKIFTTKVYISNVIILKNEKIFSKFFFLKKVRKYSWRSKVNENVQLQLDVKKITKYKTLRIRNYIFRS